MLSSAFTLQCNNTALQEGHNYFAIFTACCCPSASTVLKLTHLKKKKKQNDSVTHERYFVTKQPRGQNNKMFDLSSFHVIPQSNYQASNLFFHPFIPALLQVYMLIH